MFQRQIFRPNEQDQQVLFFKQTPQKSTKWCWYKLKEFVFSENIFFFAYFSFLVCTSILL